MKNEHSLNVHISRYHNQAHQPTQAVCPVCNKTYSNQYSLRTHMHLQARAPHISISSIANYPNTFAISFIFTPLDIELLCCAA